jgi:hypothetical protein
MRARPCVDEGEGLIRRGDRVALKLQPVAASLFEVVEDVKRGAGRTRKRMRQRRRRKARNNGRLVQ